MEQTTPNKPRGISERLSSPPLESAPPWGWLDVSNAIFTMLIAMLFVASIVGEMFAPGSFSPQGLMLGWVVGGVLTIFLVWITRRRTAASIIGLKLDRPETPMVMFLLMGVGVGITTSLIAASNSAAYLPVPELAWLLSGGDVFGWVLAVIFMVAIQPIAEQLVFQGVMLPRLRQVLGPYWVILVSGALYSIFHLLTYATLLGVQAQQVTFAYGVFAPFLAGAFFAGVRIYSQSTRAAIFTHSGAGIFAILTVFILVG